MFKQKDVNRKEDCVFKSTDDMHKILRSIYGARIFMSTIKREVADIFVETQSKLEAGKQERIKRLLRLF